MTNVTHVELRKYKAQRKALNKIDQAYGRGCLPMIKEKKTSELLETSLIYMLSALVAALGFFLVWVVCTLAGFGRT